MQFPTPLLSARLIKRYKRFLADVEMLEGPHAGTTLTVHCPNPGSMMGLANPGATIYVSAAHNPKRKLPYTFEMELVETPQRSTLVGINTMHPNTLAEEALRSGLIAPLRGYTTLKREQKYGENSRIDILLDYDRGPLTFVEVKNVHLMRRPKHVEFPDSVTIRGAKHLAELTSMVEQGHRAVMLFVSQWPGGKTLGIARDIDPAYGRAFNDALAAGVQAFALECAITLQGITPTHTIPITD